MSLNAFFHEPLPRLTNTFNACMSDCCKAGVVQTQTPVWLAQHGENLDPNANLLWHAFLSDFISYFVLLFFLLILWTPRDV